MLMVQIHLWKPQSVLYFLIYYVNLVYNRGETIKTFDLYCIILYRKILKVIGPQNKANLTHYYNTLPQYFHHKLENKNDNSLGLSTQNLLKMIIVWDYPHKTCLENEEQLMWISFPVEDPNKLIYMLLFLQVVQIRVTRWFPLKNIVIQ